MDKQAEREQKSRESDQRIFEAAIRIFGRDGFEGAKIRDIAKLAGVSSGLISQRFENKTDLLVKTYRYSVKYQQPDTWDQYRMPEAMYAMLDSMKKLVREQPEVFRFYSMLMKGVGLPEEIHWAEEEAYRHSPIHEAMLTAQREGKLPPGNPYHLYLIFLGNVGNMLANYTRYDLPLPPREFFLSAIQYSFDAVESKEKEIRDRRIFDAAVTEVYPLGIFTNLTKDTMHFMVKGQSMPDEAVNRDLMEATYLTVPDPEEQAQFRNLFGRDQLLEDYKNGVRSRVLRHRQANEQGELHWMETRAILSKNHAGDICCVFLLRNVDEEARGQEELERARKEAEQANQAKSIFLFNMSHDIRTPMNAILGYADLLERQGDDPEKRRAYTENIKISGEYLLELINNILELSRIESGKVQVDEEPADIWEMKHSVETIFQDLYKAKHLTIERDFEIRHPRVLADRTKIRQILLNIISNAVKYTPSGGTIRLHFRDLPEDPRPGYAIYQCTVEDTGIGMSGEFLPKLFDSFSRERTVTESKITGSGLGMGIVKNLVEMMDGTIRVDSELGKGTRVVIRIPLRYICDEDTMMPSDSQAKEDDISGLHILLAEDNRMNQEIAQALLEEKGAVVTTVEDGIECIAAIENGEPGTYDLVLMDVQMPNMNGYQASERIRNLSEDRSRIPIIAMTANVFEEERHRAKASGMDGFSGKPINMNDLCREICRVIKRSQ